MTSTSSCGLSTPKPSIIWTMPLNTSARLTSATPRSSIGPNTIGEARADLLVGARLLREGADPLEGAGDAGEVAVDHRRVEEVLQQVAPLARAPRP